MGVDRGSVVIAFPYPHNFTLVEGLCWLHLIVYHLIPEILLHACWNTGSRLELNGGCLSSSVQLIPREVLMLAPLDSRPSHSRGLFHGLHFAHDVHGSRLELDGDYLSLSVQLYPSWRAHAGST